MSKPVAGYRIRSRREVKEAQVQLVRRSGQGIVAVIGLASSIGSFTAFGFSWTTLAIAALVVGLLVSLLANVLFFFSARLEEEQPKKIAFLVPSSGGQPFYTAILVGLVQSAARALGQNYLVIPTMPTEDFESVSIWALFASLEDRQVDIDGIIFIPDDPDKHFDEIVGFHEERGDIPLVLVDVFFDLEQCDARTRVRLPSFVGGDERAGGQAAADIAIDALGDVADAPVVLIINGGSTPWEQQRAQAFRECFRSRWPAAQFIETPPINYSREAAFAHCMDLFRSMADALLQIELHVIFACNDDMAIGARTAVVHTLRDDYSFSAPPQIVGYDGIREIREYLNAHDPFVAGTVDVRVDEQARAAMALMHKSLRSGKRGSDIELIVPQAVRRPAR